MEKLEFHPIADTFPLMEGSEFETFAADIKAHGLREPIVMLDSKVLDGRNRLSACQLHGIKPVFKEYDGNDPVAYVLSRNLHRRHLDTSQRATVAAKIANLGHGGSRIKSPNGDLKKDGDGSQSLTQQEAATLLNVSKHTVERAAKVQKDGSEEVKQAVERGEVKVSDAAAIVDLPKAQQNGALHKVQQGEAATLQEAAGRKHKPSDTIQEWFAGGRIGKAAHADLLAMPAKKQKVFIDAVNKGATPASALAELVRQPGEEDEKPETPRKPKRVEGADSLGIPIQEHAKEAFEAQPLFDELAAKLRECRKLYAQLADHAGGAYLRRPGVSINSKDSWKHKGIETALLNLADCRPSITVCPRAYHLQAFPDCQDKTPHSESCTLCHGLNWSRPLGKEEVAQEVIAKVKEVFGVA